MFQYLLERLLWLAFILLMLIAPAVIIMSTSTTQKEVSPTAEHRLFHYWWDDRGGHWIRDIPLYDQFGSYFFRDFGANVAAVAILQVNGVLPHALFLPSEASGPTYTDLFIGTPFQIHLNTDANTLLVILPDLSVKSFALCPNDVLEIYKRISASMKSGSGPTSIIGEVKQWASEHGLKEAAEVLSQYERATPAPEFDPNANGSGEGS